nr:immunoglobulin heavy chain junction region [Mus musculus]NSM09662.1 immunoglobulin heavy chain junction region [Mus musculus]
CARRAYGNYETWFAYW